MTNIVRQEKRLTWCTDDRIKLGRIGNAENMKAIFRDMTGNSGKRGGYDYLAPRNYMSAEDDNPPTYIVKGILKCLT
jgi:hypothetical protein